MLPSPIDQVRLVRCLSEKRDLAHDGESATRQTSRARCQMKTPQTRIVPEIPALVQKLNNVPQVAKTKASAA
jgi:hypothetical protein